MSETLPESEEKKPTIDPYAAAAAALSRYGRASFKRIIAATVTPATPPPSSANEEQFPPEQA